MDKIYKILGKRGRVTIPIEIRQEMGFSYNDVVSFQQNGNTVTVRREKICTDCKGKIEQQKITQTEDSVSLLELLDNFSIPEQRAALIHLSVKWAHMQKGDDYSA